MMTTEDVKARLEHLEEQWQEDTRYSSSMTDRVNHPALRQIIALGMPVVPILLQRLAKEERSFLCSVALPEITGENPAEGEQSAAVAGRKWLEWGRERGLIE